MKKNFIKVLFMTVSALLCSHLWAQGSESAGDWFYITMDDSKKNFQSLRITTENGKHKIIDGLIPNSNSTGYTAFFIGDNGSYYIYDKKNNKNSWFAANPDEIDAINKLYSFVNNKNSTVTSEEKDIYIKNAGYANVEKSLINIKKSEYNPVRTRNNGFNELYIYDELKGVFGFALYPEDSDMVQIICFRDTKSIAEISSAALGTNDNPYNDFFTWLKKSPENKITNKKNEEYKRVAQLIYESLKNKDSEKCLNLYTTNNILFRKYLQLAQNESRNVFSPESGIHYKTIEKEEGKKIADEADKYVNTVITLKSVFTTKNIVVPMPYKAGKKNTPEDFKNIKKQKDLINFGCDNTSFVAEIMKKAIGRNDLYDSYDDLSKYSLLISDVNDARVGDLVFFEYAPIQQGFTNIQGKKCGIIVETPNVNEEFGTYQKESLGNLSVIWMNEDRGAEKKKLSEIWNIGEGFEVPLYTEIRRVSKAEDVTDNEIFWNVLDDKDPEINVEIGCMRENTQNSADRYRWIPNTGEYLSLERISISAYNKIGIRLKGEDWKVTLNGAVDRDWKEGNTEGNIYNNSDCKFDIKVGDFDAKLIKDQNERYAINWGVSNEDTEKTSFVIEGSDNILKYADTNEVAEILIRPESAEKARPGDDLLLEFKISNGSIEKEVTVSPTDYIAVYDKKMLWRANLYINKPEAALGGEDWNNAHPWNVPVNNNDTTTNTPDWWNPNWGYNEWNAYTMLNENGDEEIQFANGRQIPIENWSKWNGGADVQNSVAYGWGAMDSVENFNTELLKQSRSIRSFRENNQTYSELTWADNQTTAPNGDWNNYIFAERKKQNGVANYGSNLSVSEKQTITQHTYTASSNPPSVPGLSTQVRFGSTNYYNHTDSAGTTHYSNSYSFTSGLDCSGLATITTNYKLNNDYVYEISGAKKGTTDFVKNNYTISLFAASSNNKWNINPEVTNNTPNEIISQRDTHRKILSHAVPGDIFVVSGSHVVILQNLNYYLNNSVITDYKQVDVIHSTSGIEGQWKTYQVHKGNWYQIEAGDTNKEYQLRRLIRK